MKWQWPRISRIYWDPWRNIPVIKPRQEEIDLLLQLKLTEPCDARPAFRGDYERLRDAVRYEFGSDRFYSRFIENRFILLNKIPHWDLMYEVVCSGNVIGQLYYDPYGSKWRFRLTHQGAYLALENGVVDSVKANPPFYVDRVIENKSTTSSRQVVVVDERGIIRGIGEVEDIYIRVVKAFYDRSMLVETSDKPTSIEDALRYNIDGLEILEEKSIRFLQRLEKRYHRSPRPVVSYSGGKDSLVALDIAHRALGDIDILFNDTGLEMPETLGNVEKITQLYDSRLHVASAGDVFWRSIEVFGPPGKDYRWCCKVAKLVPIAKLTKTMWPSGALNIVGQRAFESLDRARSPLIWRNKWIPHMISTTPIQYWNQLTCWIYIYRHRLPYNRLYEEGFDRLGCYLCPSCALAEFKDVERLYPDLWYKWIDILENWRKRLGQPAEWINLGLWRWLTPATAKKRIVYNLKEYTIDWVSEYRNRLIQSKIRLTPVRIDKTRNKIEVEFNENIFTDTQRDIFVKNIVNLGYDLLEDNPLVLRKTDTTIEIRDRVIKATSCNEDSLLESLVDVLKITYRIRGCILCGSCVLWSKKGSVKLTREGPLLREKLDEKYMELYIEVCPISDQLVEKITVSLVTGDYKSYKRRTRRKRLT